MSLEAPQSVKNGTDADAMPPMPPPPQPASKPRLCRRCGQVKKGHTCTNPPPKEGAKNGSNGSHSNGSNGSSTPSPEGPSPEGPTFSGGEFSDQPVLASGGANPILTTSADVLACVGGAASWPASMTKDNWETPKDTWKSQKAEGRSRCDRTGGPLPPLTKQLRGRKEAPADEELEAALARAAPKEGSLGAALLRWATERPEAAHAWQSADAIGAALVEWGAGWRATHPDARVGCDEEISGASVHRELCRLMARQRQCVVTYELQRSNETSGDWRFGGGDDTSGAGSDDDGEGSRPPTPVDAGLVAARRSEYEAVVGALTHVFSKHGLPPVIPALPYTIVTDNPQPTGKHWEKYGASGLGLEIVHEVQRRVNEAVKAAAAAAGAESVKRRGWALTERSPSNVCNTLIKVRRASTSPPSLLPLTPSPPPSTDAWARGRRRGPARVRRVRAGVDCARLAAQLGAGEARRGAGGVAGGEGGGAAAGGARRRRAELLAAEGRRPQARPRRGRGARRLDGGG